MPDSAELLTTIGNVAAKLDSVSDYLQEAATNLGNAPQKNKDENITQEWVFLKNPKVPDTSLGDKSEKAPNTKSMNDQIDKSLADAFTAHDDNEDAHSDLVISIKDELRSYVEKTTHGVFTVIRDINDNPHVMKRISRFRFEDVAPSLSLTGEFPAFIIGGQVVPEILIGGYKLSPATKGNATIAGEFPKVSINFDQALAACRVKEKGGQRYLALNTLANAAAENLLLYKEFGDNHEYLGNSNYGRSHSKHEQTGVLKNGTYMPGDTGNPDAATKCGSGGEAWNDNGRWDGLADWVGNVWEWLSGMRINESEIQVIENNNAMLPTCDMSATSVEWKAFLQSGSLVAPGTAGTLKYDGSVADATTKWVSAGAYRLNTVLTNQNVNGYYTGYFKDLTAASGITIPGILKALGLMPSGVQQGHTWMCNKGERLPIRGGSWSHGGHVGPWALDLADVRAHSGRHVGARAAFASYTV